MSRPLYPNTHWPRDRLGPRITLDRAGHSRMSCACSHSNQLPVIPTELSRLPSRRVFPVGYLTTLSVSGLCREGLHTECPSLLKLWLTVTSHIPFHGAEWRVPVAPLDHGVTAFGPLCRAPPCDRGNEAVGSAGYGQGLMAGRHKRTVGLVDCCYPWAMCRRTTLIILSLASRAEVQDDEQSYVGRSIEMAPR
jgi:hypothetical protein